jgi:hypothetical protein
MAFIQFKAMGPLEPGVRAPDAFLTPPSFEELARLQGVKPLEDTNVLAGGFPEEEDIDEFLNDIYKHRETA